MKIRMMAVAAALVAVTACGGDDDTETTTGESSTVTESTADASTGASTPGETTQPDATTDPDGTFRYAHYFELTRFDPHLASNAGDGNILFLAYDRLIHLTTEAEPAPGLAEAWEFSDDGLTLTLTLREGVTFQDGEPFDASAVKANLERAKSIEGSAVAADLANVVAVDAPDATTAVLTLAEPQASLLAVLSDRHGAMISPAAFDNADLEKDPVGTGMYRLVDYRPGDRITFERNEDYWDPSAVGSARFEWVIMGEATTRLNALKSGQIDAAILEAPQIEDAERSGLQVETRTTVVYQQIYMNRARAPFDDPDVRRALNYAVDREAMVQAIEHGHGAPNSQVFPEGYWAFNEDIGTDYYTYDPDKARALLNQAGYPDGFEFEMLVPIPGTPLALAEILQAQFAEIGVSVTPVQSPTQSITDVFFVQEQGPAMLAFWSGRQDPSMTTTQRWTAEGFANPGDHTTPEIEALNTEALTTLDPEERAEAMHRLVAEATEQAFDLVLYNPVNIQAASDDVAVLPQVILNGKIEFRGTGMAG